MHGPLGDRAVLLLTFALTVMLDLTVAIEVGLVLAAFLFMHRMSEVVAIGSNVTLLEEDRDDFTRRRPRASAPSCRPAWRPTRCPGRCSSRSPTDSMTSSTSSSKPPRVFILRMRQVPLIDASGVTALRQCCSAARVRHARHPLGSARSAARDPRRRWASHLTASSYSLRVTLPRRWSSRGTMATQTCRARGRRATTAAKRSISASVL